ncbi:MAG: hypothetical protein FWD53_11760, partial [Phycisphaerales bacterium]|nr:hypothetical protein [Phycisphaerales bacterium]
MSETRKNRRSPGVKSKRGVHPPQYRNGSGGGHHGSLTIVTPAADMGDELDQIQVEYVTPLTEALHTPAPAPPTERKQNPPSLPKQAATVSVEPEALAPSATPTAEPPPPTPEFTLQRASETPIAPSPAPLSARVHTTPPHTPLATPTPHTSTQPLLFEIAWEVCWQLGGIYTVLRSKAPQMTKAWGDRYCLIGPYNGETAAVELEECPATGPIAFAIEKLRNMGIKVHHGRWLITGRPRVMLLEFGAALDRIGEFKYYLWKDHGIQAPESDQEVSNVISFSFLVGLFFQELTKTPNLQQPIMAHFHEWMSGLGILRIKHLQLPVATVFTTHATLLGRYLCTDNPDFYSKLPWINPDHAAGHYNIYARYSIERGSAHAADVFTTVSDITGIEAEKLLGRRPDVVTPNGLNIQKFTAIHEFQNLHKDYKEIIHQFVSGHFFPSYNFDLERTIYLFISGRYEYRNKGMDIFIESLARLNHWLRAGGIPINVVAFIITRAPCKNINVDVLRNQSMFDELNKICEHVTEDMGDALVHAVSQGRLPERGELLTEEAIVKLKRTMHAWRTWKQPPIVTHDLWHDATDPVLCQLRSCQLFNAKHDPVKVVYHPDFVTATSTLLGLDYED